MTSPCECLRLALDEQRGWLIRALYDLPEDDLERLVEAAQLIDSEGVEILDSYHRECILSSADDGNYPNIDSGAGE